MWIKQIQISNISTNNVGGRIACVIRRSVKFKWMLTPGCFQCVNVVPTVSAPLMTAFVDDMPKCQSSDKLVILLVSIHRSLKFSASTVKSVILAVIAMKLFLHLALVLGSVRDVTEYRSSIRDLLLLRRSRNKGHAKILRFTVFAGCNTDIVLVDCGQYALPNQSFEDLVFLCFSRVLCAWLQCCYCAAMLAPCALL